MEVENNSLIWFSAIVLAIAVGFILWYLFVSTCLFSCLTKSPTFILLFSQAINDIYGLSQSAWQPILRLVGVANEDFLPNRWLSVIHGSFELISLPHYIFIALNRALFLIDHTKMGTVFSTRKTIILCGFMWIVPLILNILLHVFAPEDDAGFYLFGTTLEMGSDSLGIDFQSYISSVFDLSFYVTAVVVIAIYTIAIIWHSYKRRVLIVTTNFITTATSGSPNFGMEMRLTIVCLMNLVPPTLTTIIDFTWQDRGTIGGFVYAILTMTDNCVNSFVLPLFSQLLRECVKRKLVRAMFWRKKKEADQTMMLNSRISRATIITTVSTMKSTV